MTTTAKLSNATLKRIYQSADRLPASQAKAVHAEITRRLREFPIRASWEQQQ